MTVHSICHTEGHSFLLQNRLV